MGVVKIHISEVFWEVIYMTEAKKAKLIAWGKNLLKFTAPVLAIFFYQLSQGVDLKNACLIALFGLYALLFDLFKKLG